MRLIIPFIRTVVWGEESPKTIVRMFFSPLHGVLVLYCNRQGVI